MSAGKIDYPAVFPYVIVNFERQPFYVGHWYKRQQNTPPMVSIEPTNPSKALIPRLHPGAW